MNDDSVFLIHRAAHIAGKHRSHIKAVLSLIHPIAQFAGKHRSHRETLSSVGVSLLAMNDNDNAQVGGT